MTAHVRVVSASKDEIESDITIAGEDGEPLAVFTGFIVQSLSASSRMSPERVDKGLYEIQWVADADIQQDRARRSDFAGQLVLARLRRRRRRRDSARGATAPQRPACPNGHIPTRRRADRNRRRVRTEPARAPATTPAARNAPRKGRQTSPASSTAGRWTSVRKSTAETTSAQVQIAPSQISARRLHDPASRQSFRTTTTPSSPACTWSPPTRNQHLEPKYLPSNRPPSGGSAG